MNCSNSVCESLLRMSANRDGKRNFILLVEGQKKVRLKCQFVHLTQVPELQPGSLKSDIDHRPDNLTKIDL